MKLTFISGGTGSSEFWDRKLMENFSSVKTVCKDRSDRATAEQVLGLCCGIFLSFQTFAFVLLIRWNSSLDSPMIFFIW